MLFPSVDVDLHRVCCCSLSFICDSFNFSSSVSHRSVKLLLWTEVPWAVMLLCLLHRHYEVFISPLLSLTRLSWFEQKWEACTLWDKLSWQLFSVLTDFHKEDSFFFFCLFSATICLPTVWTKTNSKNIANIDATKAKSNHPAIVSTFLLL